MNVELLCLFWKNNTIIYYFITCTHHPSSIPVHKISNLYVFGVLIIYNFDCTAGVSWLLAQKYYIEKCSLLARYWGTDGTTRIFHSGVQFLRLYKFQSGVQFFLIFYTLSKPKVLSSSSKILHSQDIWTSQIHCFELIPK